MFVLGINDDDVSILIPLNVIVGKGSITLRSSVFRLVFAKVSQGTMGLYLKYQLLKDQFLIVFYTNLNKLKVYVTRLEKRPLEVAIWERPRSLLCKGYA